MSTQIYRSGSTLSLENRIYLERPRLNQVLEDAIKNPLVIISASAGYGKTQAVYSFLQKYEIATTWIQLSERDNLTTRFWENCVYTIALYNRTLAKRLYEMRFPETDDRFLEYLSILEDNIAPGARNLVVFDDLHLITDKAVLQFIRRFAQSPTPGRATILISRTEPDVNMIDLLSKGLVVTINENDLRFTEEETAQYFQLLDIPMFSQSARSSESISNIYNDTDGWPLALNLIGLALKKAPYSEQAARISMKLNIFRMIEDEIFHVISEKLRRFLVRLSLVTHLSTDLVFILAGDESLMDEMGKISSFIRHDIFTNAYLIHHLFLDYLQQKQNILTEEEKRDTYLKAARWCEENDYNTDAIFYYDKAGEYESTIRVVYHLPPQIPFNEAKFILDIYDHAPAGAMDKFETYCAQRARLLVSVGRYADAVEEMNGYIKKYSDLPATPFNNRILCGAYMALGTISYLTLARTDRCDFDVLMEKADYYYRLSPFSKSGPETRVILDAWASRVGTTRRGAMEEYIATLTRAIPYAGHVLNGFMYGLDDLARGELYFFKGDLKMAEQFCRQAQQKAEERGQYEVRNRAIFYLLRIGVAQGNFEKIQELLKELEAQLGMTEYFSRYLSYDIVSSWYYSLLGQPQFVANWLKGNFSQGTLPIFQSDFGNVIKAKFNYSNKQYDELLSFLENDQKPYSALLRDLEKKTYEAVCKYHIKDRDAALATLQEAYGLALSNDLIMPFIEMGKDMRTLTAAAMRDKKCDIPRQWLETINQKAATYAKRLSLVVSEYKKANDMESDVPLSSREIDVLNDLSHGLSRPEIADSHGLSVNTVKMVLNAIYEKLNANNVADVLRIAFDRKLIK